MAVYATILLFFLSVHLCFAQIKVDTSFNEHTLVREVFVSDTSDIKTIYFYGSYQALGLITANKASFPFSKGIILSTGMAKSASRPNRSPNRSSALRTNGDKTLNKLSGQSSYDAAILEFTFRPRHNTLAFEYIFASEEYPEYVDKGFNDVFAFILTDLETRKEKNLALVPGTSLPVHVDNINHKRNTKWFISNTSIKNSPYLQVLEYDGLTKVLTARSKVIPGRYYRIKLAIADVDDMMLDSSVILKEKSFRSFPSETEKILSDSLAATLLFVYFDLESSSLSTKAKNELRTFAKQVLTYRPSAVRVTGHTDTRGSDAYNERLAFERVQSVVNYLATLGLRNKVKLYRQSLGEKQPVASNKMESGRMLNRRVELKMEF